MVGMKVQDMTLGGLKKVIALLESEYGATDSSRIHDLGLYRTDGIFYLDLKVERAS
jgi:hypothetical protein